MGGVRTHESRPVNQCTHAHRRMTRGLTRDVMTTDTENHTSTTTIASSRALDSTARFFHLASTSTSRPLARAPPVGMDAVRDGTRRRTRSRDAETTTTTDSYGVGLRSRRREDARRRRPRSSAFIAFAPSSRAFSRAFIRRTRARIRRARDENGGESTSREIARVRLARGA